jgi:hypothetical protein
LSEVDVLPEPASPYSVDLNQNDLERPRTKVGDIVVGIGFGTIAAFTAFCATSVFGLFCFEVIELPVFRRFELSPGAERQLVFLSVMTLAFVIAALTFITVFYVARNLKWR